MAYRAEALQAPSKELMSELVAAARAAGVAAQAR